MAGGRSAPGDILREVSCYRLKYNGFSDVAKGRGVGVNWTSSPCLYFSYCPLYRVWRQAGFLRTYFCFPLAYL